MQLGLKFYFLLTLLILPTSCYGLQSISRESNDKHVVAMLDELTIEVLSEESFVIVLQHDARHNMKMIYWSNLDHNLNQFLPIAIHVVLLCITFTHEYFSQSCKSNWQIHV